MVVESLDAGLLLQLVLSPFHHGSSEKEIGDVELGPARTSLLVSYALLYRLFCIMHASPTRKYRGNTDFHEVHKATDVAGGIAGRRMKIKLYCIFSCSTPSITHCFVLLHAQQVQ